MSTNLPPQDLDAEIHVLGGILIDNKALKRALEVIDRIDFYLEKNRRVFSAMMALDQKKEPIDIITLCDSLRSFGVLDNAGGPAYISSLADGVATAANIKHYCKIIKNKSLARRSLELTNEVQNAISEGGDVLEIMSKLRYDASQVASHHSDVEVYTMGEVVKETFKHLEASYENKGSLTGLPTGLKDLDKATSGFQPGDFILLGGRPSMGKSVLCDGFLNACGVPALFFSLEMSKERYCKRSLSSSGRVNHARTTSAQFQESDWPKLTRAAGDLSSKPIYVIDKSNLNIDKIVSISERLYEEKQIGMIVIDYLQFISCRGRSREQEVSEISSKLKGLAKDLNIPLVALTALNRKVDERPDKRPMLSDLRESGMLEFDADVIMFIYRPGYPDYGFTDDDIDKLYRGMDEKPKTLQGLAELDIAKGRDIKLGTIFLKEELEYQRFADYSMNNNSSRGDWER
jgi:replicative DNA helicase